MATVRRAGGSPPPAPAATTWINTVQSQLRGRSLQSIILIVIGIIIVLFLGIFALLYAIVNFVQNHLILVGLIIAAIVSIVIVLNKTKSWVRWLSITAIIIGFFFLQGISSSFPNKFGINTKESVDERATATTLPISTPLPPAKPALEGVVVLEQGKEYTWKKTDQEFYIHIMPATPNDIVLVTFEGVGSTAGHGWVSVDANINGTPSATLRRSGNKIFEDPNGEYVFTVDKTTPVSIYYKPKE